MKQQSVNLRVDIWNEEQTNGTYKYVLWSQNWALIITEQIKQKYELRFKQYNLADKKRTFPRQFFDGLLLFNSINSGKRLKLSGITK